MIFATADFSRLELHAYAQACLTLVGHSQLADRLNSGIDPLTSLACRMHSVSYAEGLRLKDAEEPVFGNIRTCAKGCMYGFMGMLGPKSFPHYARKAYGVVVTEEETRKYKNDWRQEVPESWAYENYVKTLQTEDGQYLVRHVVSGRLRKTPFLPAACNSFFQGLGADAAGHALFLVSEACYAVPSSPLFGCRVVNFVHDEIILECEEERGHEALAELQRLMCEGANVYLADVPVKTDGKLMKFWSKYAKRLEKDGRVVPWPQAA